MLYEISLQKKTAWHCFWRFVFNCFDISDGNHIKSVWHVKQRLYLCVKRAIDLSEIVHCLKSPGWLLKSPNLSQRRPGIKTKLLECWQTRVKKNRCVSKEMPGLRSKSSPAKSLMFLEILCRDDDSVITYLHFINTFDSWSSSPFEIRAFLNGGHVQILACKDV